MTAPEPAPRRRGLVRKITLTILAAVALQGVALLFWGVEALWSVRISTTELFLDTLEKTGVLDQCDADPEGWVSPGRRLLYPVAPDGRLYTRAGPEVGPISTPGPGQVGPVARGAPGMPKALIYETGREGPCHLFVVAPLYTNIWQAPFFNKLLVARLAVDMILIVALSLAIGLPLVRRVRRMARAARGTVEADFEGLLPEEEDELGELGEAFNAATAAARARLRVLRRRDQVLRETLADLAHDVRTPLATLKLGLSRGEGGGAHQGALRAEVEHLDAMFQNLASLLQFEASGLDIQTTTLDAGELLERVALRFQVMAADKGVSIEVALPEGPLPLVADPVALAQAVGNLAHNAIKFGEREVTLAALLRAGEIRLQVFDDGPGVDLEELPRLAERRYRGQSGPALGGDRGRRGQGLGLAIAREVAERHGGRLELAPLEEGGGGGGTVACLILPAAP